MLVWKPLAPVIATLFVLGSPRSQAGMPALEEIALPPLRIQGKPARAHTQGMELHRGEIFVTARWDNVRPKRALLLRTHAEAKDWEVWDLTPLDGQGHPTNLDHPGGMQSDGTRLWIPLAESRRQGRSLIRAFRLRDLVPGQPLKPELEFSVDDHIGAVAVSADRQWLLGANWDTEQVYVWDFTGRVRLTLTPPELQLRELGARMGSASRAGLAVQDWKFVGARLFASGLARSAGPPPGATESHLVCFTNFFGADFQRWTVKLPPVGTTQLAREAMAISEGRAHFLPEDLSATNRLFRIPLADLRMGAPR